MRGKVQAPNPKLQILKMRGTGFVVKISLRDFPVVLETSSRTKLNSNPKNARDRI